MLVDAVGEGFIKSLAKPGGNVTGFGVMEFSIFGKFLETLKQIAPGTSRVAMIYNPDNPSGVQFRRLFESFALPLSVQPIISPIHSIADIERATEALAKQPNGGVFFPPDFTTIALRDQVTAIVARLRLPAIYSDRLFVTSGGLVSYDADRTEIWRRTASYIDRVLRGKNPAICRFSSRRNTSSRSILRPPKRLALPCRTRCSPPLTRSSSRPCFAAVHTSAFDVVDGARSRQRGAVR